MASIGTASNVTPLVSFASEQQRRYHENTTADLRKASGHFGTPPEISAFMAGLFSTMPSGRIRILDPGAGVGILAAAICDRIATLREPREIAIEAWEIGAPLCVFLHDTLNRCRAVLGRAGHRVEYSVRHDDFILANAKGSLLESPSDGNFNLAILNPPYFKLRKESEHARTMSYVVHGQPNIYVLFMAAVVDLLKPGGEMVAITPRSYFNGPYFRKFRQWFFDRMTPSHIHVFESRTEAFRSDEVLQETVILRAVKSTKRGKITITTSHGKDALHVTDKRFLDYSQIIDNSTGDYIIRVGTTDHDQQIIDAIDALPCTLADLGLRISTGPVVTFRATEHLLHERQPKARSAPLLMMHNVRPFVTIARGHNGKPTHIAVSPESMNILVPSLRYILLKRFTAKEEKRRLVAGIFERSDSYSEYVGLENHLNYVYKATGELTRSEAYGLAALFNSAFLDRYFRALSGNTQVNAAEIRALRLPTLKTIAALGDRLLKAEQQPPTRRDVEMAIGDVMSLPDDLRDYLMEIA